MNTLSPIVKTAIPAWSALIIISYLSLIGSAGAAEAQARQAHDWQTQRLLHPTDHQLNSDRHGHIFIYDGLSPQVIERAMDQAFDRIEAMMFINSDKAEHSSTPDTGNSSDDTSDTDDGGCE